MPLLLRKIDNRRWDRTPELAWLAQGDLPADPLGDLQTKNNRLSVWVIRDDRSNLEQVMATMVATWDHLDKFDYALFDQDTVSRLGIDIQETPGGTPDPEADHWHRDLVELSGHKPLELALAMWACGERDRRPENEIRELLAKAVNLRRIQPDALRPKVRMLIPV